MSAVDSEDGDFFYDEEEVLNGVGAENRAALLERYDAMLGDSEQPEEVHSSSYCTKLQYPQCLLLLQRYSVEHNCCCALVTCGSFWCAR